MAPVRRITGIVQFNFLTNTVRTMPFIFMLKKRIECFISVQYSLKHKYSIFLRSHEIKLVFEN